MKMKPNMSRGRVRLLMFAIPFLVYFLSMGLGISHVITEDWILHVNFFAIGGILTTAILLMRHDMRKTEKRLNEKFYHGEQ